MSNDKRGPELDQNCQGWREEFSAYIDGELSEERKAAVGQHLSTCSACSAFLANLNSVDDLLLGLQSPTVPGQMLTSIKERFRQEEGRELDIAPAPAVIHASWTWSAPLLAVAAVLVLLAVVRFKEPPVSGQMVNQAPSQVVIEGLEEEELLFLVDSETIEEMELLEDLDVLEAMAREQHPGLFSGKATRS